MFENGGVISALMETFYEKKIISANIVVENQKRHLS